MQSFGVSGVHVPLSQVAGLQTVPHAGPVTNFMAKCEPDCGRFTGVGEKVWFKADEQAFQDEPGWPTVKLADTGYVEMKVPECLAPGEYLIRHEIISMTECAKPFKCQLYPGCAQIKVEGSGTVRHLHAPSASR